MKVDTVEWHEECLVNQKKRLEIIRCERDELNERIKKLCDNVDLKEWQIYEAKRIGKTKFDDTKFRVKRK